MTASPASAGVSTKFRAFARPGPAFCAGPAGAAIVFAANPIKIRSIFYENSTGILGKKALNSPFIFAV
jgi:hypothetical protein